MGHGRVAGHGRAVRRVLPADLVHDTGELPYTYDLGQMLQLTVVGTRIMLGALYSDDDGRSWSQVDRWR